MKIGIAIGIAVVVAVGSGRNVNDENEILRRFQDTLLISQHPQPHVTRNSTSMETFECRLPIGES